MHDQRKNCNTGATNQQTYSIETSPYLIDEDVRPKVKFINTKNTVLNFLKENSYIDFIFLREDVAVQINIML